MRLMWVVMNRLTWVEVHSETDVVGMNGLTWVAMHSETDVGRDE